MPNCFMLISKVTNQPMALQDVDLMICQRLEIPYSNDEWAGNWYHSIGFSLSTGTSLPDLIDIYQRGAKDSKRIDDRDNFLQGIRIAALLNENFYVSTWAER